MNRVGTEGEDGVGLGFGEGGCQSRWKSRLILESSPGVRGEWGWSGCCTLPRSPGRTDLRLGRSVEVSRRQSPRHRRNVPGKGDLNIADSISTHPHPYRSKSTMNCNFVAKCDSYTLNLFFITPPPSNRLTAR
jgi:hypothetical protein